MKQLTITLGRNIGSTPMTAAQWVQFQSRTIDLITLHAHIPVAPHDIELHYGTGVWDNVPEDSVKLSALSDASWNIKALSLDLTILAAEYRQDAIALSLCEPTLIHAL